MKSACKMVAFLALLAVVSASVVEINWSAPANVSSIEGVPTYLNQVNPSMDRESPIHDEVNKQMCALGTSLVRYLYWSWSEAPFPELIEGVFNFTLTDQYVLDFMQCPNAQDSVINFDMWGGPDWLHVNGSRTLPLRDPSGVEYGEWISRLISWYTKGGFTDNRTGKVYKSGHHLNWTNYEVLNEPDGQPYMSSFVDGWGFKIPPYAAYTRIYDGIAGVLRRDHPELKLHALSLMSINDAWFSYFFDDANHIPGTPVPSYVTYHYYAYPSTVIGDKPGIGDWPTELFTQARSFMPAAEQSNSVIRKGSFGGDRVKISVNEVGVIGGAVCPVETLFNNSKQYWNLKAALWGFYYGELTRLGASAVASSQIIGYPANEWTIRGAGVSGNYPCVSMLDWHDGSGTAVYWAVKMFQDVLGTGNKSVFATSKPTVKCEDPFPFPSSTGVKVCYNATENATAGRGPCGSWCTIGAPQGNMSWLGCPQPPSRLCPWVPAGTHYEPDYAVYSIGFQLHSRGHRVLLLTNTDTSQVHVHVAGVEGSTMHVVDDEAGHRHVPYATKVLDSNDVQLGPLAVALIVMKAHEAQAAFSWV